MSKISPCSCFPIFRIYFSHFSALTGVSMMLRGERSHLYLSPNLKGNTVNILPLKVMLFIVFALNISYKYLRYVNSSLEKLWLSQMTQPHQPDPYKLRGVCCFKLLNMGVICYIAIDNSYRRMYHFPHKVQPNVTAASCGGKSMCFRIR